MFTIHHHSRIMHSAVLAMLAVFMCFTTVGFSQKVAEKNQQTFKIVKLGAVYSEQTVIKTFEAANLSFHRFQTMSNIILLDDNTEVEIFPASTLVQSGVIADVSSYSTGYPSKYLKSTFSIAKGTILIEQRPTINSDKVISQ